MRAKEMIKEITASKRERKGGKMKEREKEWRKETERRKLGERKREKERELFMAITKVSERDAQRTSSVLILSSFPRSLFLPLTIFLLCQLRIQSQVNTREEEEKEDENQEHFSLSLSHHFVSTKTRWGMKRWMREK